MSGTVERGICIGLRNVGLVGIHSHQGKNILQECLVDPKKVLLPPLHIKLGLMKQFIKALPPEGDDFTYLCREFPGLSDAKIKEGVFVALDIRKLMNDENFESCLGEEEEDAWISFKNLIKTFLDNRKSKEYKDIVGRILETFKALGCNMSSFSTCAS